MTRRFTIAKLPPAATALRYERQCGERGVK